ncbi:hypothetical protein BU15DRAFT_60359 [Melanogaster broomeanus]|nr:hypothetical protein BU15DRAFT_60359 [Melanogaster broomeanus]
MTMQRNLKQTSTERWARTLLSLTDSDAASPLTNLNGVYRLAVKPQSEVLVSILFRSAVDCSWTAGEWRDGPKTRRRGRPTDSLPDYNEANLQGTLDRTYLTITVPPVEFSKTEERLNNVEDRVLLSPYHNVVTTFYNNNATAIKDSAVKVTDALNNTAAIKAVEDNIRAFGESSKVLMKMLDEVAKVHPFVAVAVLAFKAVVTLELKRRDNDKKVIRSQVEMKDMMSILLRLRYVRDPKQLFPDGTTIEGRMQQLMKDIADDITNCGNICDAYTKKSLVAKVFKGPVWEGRLADFADTFVRRRQEIELALSIHTTLGVDSANRALSDLQEGLQAVHDKLNMLLLFKKLETPAEKEIAKFVAETKGGQAALMENDDLLQRAIVLGRGARANAKDVKEAQPSLAPGSVNKTTSKGSTPDVQAVRNELAEDIDKTLANNMELFDRKLRVQQKQLIEQLDRVVHREGDRIISVGPAQTLERYGDSHVPVIIQCVDRVSHKGWKGTVKARHFILALHDYFLDKFSEDGPGQVPMTPMSIASSLPPDEDIEPGTMLELALSQQPRSKTDDRWALAYINVTRMQPILEAFDDDGSGFVSVKEVNTFTSSRPKGWSLPHWLAYWAAGWHSVTWEYTLRIKRVIQTMHDHLPSIEQLCASVRVCEDEIYQDGQLDEKIRPYVEEEQARIATNLESVMWNIDAMNTLALVVGPGRIERYILPLLYVLLKHHLKIIKLACKGIFAKNDLSEARSSLSSVMGAAGERIANLEALFKQKGLDVETQLGSVAFGMFKMVHSQDYDELDEDRDSSYDSDSENVDDDSISPSILKHGFIDRVPDYSNEGRPEIRGVWTGIREEAEETSGARAENGCAGDPSSGTFFYMNISTDQDNGGLKGDGFERNYPFTIEGSPRAGRRQRYSIGNQLQQNTERSAIATPRQDFQCNPARARWQLCVCSVLHQVKRSRWSWEYFKARADERKQFVKLWKRRELGREWSSMEATLGDDEEDEEDREREVEKLLAWTSQADLTYWKSLAIEEFRKFTVHGNAQCDSCEIVMLGKTDNCFGAEVVTPSFTHEQGHPVVKLRKLVHMKGAGTFIRFARKASERASDILRMVEEESRNGGHEVTAGDEGEDVAGNENPSSGNGGEEDAEVSNVDLQGDGGPAPAGSAGTSQAGNDPSSEDDNDGDSESDSTDSNDGDSSTTDNPNGIFFPRPRGPAPPAWTPQRSVQTSRGKF